MPAGVVVATVTGNIGPGLTATSRVINNVRNINFRFADGSVDIYSDDLPGGFATFQYSAMTTVTFTPASKTVVMS